MTLGSDAVTDVSTILGEIGEQVDWASGTADIDAQTGDAIEGYATSVEITAIVLKKTTPGETHPEGYRDGDVLSIVVSGGASVDVFDKVSHDSVDYKVLKVEESKSNNKTVFKKCSLARIVSDG